MDVRCPPPRRWHTWPVSAEKFRVASLTALPMKILAARILADGILPNVTHMLRHGDLDYRTQQGGGCARGGSHGQEGDGGRRRVGIRQA